ncbi:hypothetical protein EV356DRAFT_561343 [Viridothelium virens]|uniref:Sequence orphan n=1 Tax=Viridothelium virens TaxID=1048519 RepID=A0A6A6GYS9_VIRVR|nr:hypothetical protein EV356DRAFT_561343 [Viridothelium virens]
MPNDDTTLRAPSTAEWLARSLAGDVTAAVTAAAAVSPIMTVIDRAVVENAAGQCPLLASTRASLRTLVRRPRQFFMTRSFSAMFFLYMGTYLTANTIDTMSSYKQGLPAASATSSSAKFLAVTSVNVGLALNKDSVFARSFGTQSSRSRSLPLISYIPFLMRDAITLFATFNVPSLLALKLPDTVECCMSKLSTAQLVAPAASQFLTTPLHLLGLDLYYRSGKLSSFERVKAAKKAWLSTSLARACRIVPAYGVGGVINNNMKMYMTKSPS